MMRTITAAALLLFVPAFCMALQAPGQKTAMDEIRTAVVSEIKKSAPKCAAISVEFIKPETLTAFSGAVSISAATSDNLSRKMKFRISGFMADKKIEINTQALVEAVCPVIVVSRTLSARSVILKTDLAYEDKNIAAMNFIPFMGDGSGIVGERAANALQKGRVIAPFDIEKTPVISPGALVTIICTDENMKMESQGRAEEQGAIGDSIKVRNTSSKKIIMARVVSPSTVRTGE
jgi:flagella basal body P-ring formation protein FlgA